MGGGLELELYRLDIFRRSLGELAICRHETIPSKCSNVRSLSRLPRAYFLSFCVHEPVGYLTHLRSHEAGNWSKPPCVEVAVGEDVGVPLPFCAANGCTGVCGRIQQLLAWLDLSAFHCCKDTWK